MFFSKHTPKKRIIRTPGENRIHPASFRDPNGSLYFENGNLVRKVNFIYKKNYDFLIKSGLYVKLVGKKYLIPHKELKVDKKDMQVYKVLKPDVVPFVSYPYEWCFSQLRDAALLTLAINKFCIKNGMILKDASAYNVLFKEGRPIFIDTLSFEIYNEGSPWVAYQQFCKHFLSPLLLAAYIDYRLMQLSKVFIDGIPLDLTSKLLPIKSRFNFSVLSNIHLQVKAQKALENKFVKRKIGYVSSNSLLAIMDNLENLISGLKLGIINSEWRDYYQDNSYKKSSLKNKKDIVRGLIRETGGVGMLWDLGANTGYFSKDIVTKNTIVINFDNDFLTTENNYKDVRERKLTNVLPLIMDLTNPSSNVGWANDERSSIIERGPCDVALALALIHHLAITNNLPFNLIAEFFSRICKWLIIEYVPKSDIQVRKMLINREDIFPKYTQTEFEAVFTKYFRLYKKMNVKNSERIVYLFKLK